MIPTKHSPQTKEQAFKLYCKGVEFKEIARQMDVSLAAVRGWSSNGKWKARRLIAGTPKKGMVALVEHETKRVLGDSDTDTSKQDVEFLLSVESLPFEEKQAHFREQMAVQALRIPVILASMSRDDLVKNADRLHKLESIARRALNLEEPTPAPVINIGLLSASGTLPPLENGPTLTQAPTITEESLRVDSPRPIATEENSGNTEEASEANG
jgi:transposase-like protein